MNQLQMKIAAVVALLAACLVGLALLLRRELSPSPAAPASVAPPHESGGKSVTGPDRSAAVPAPAAAPAADPRRLLADLAKALRNSDEKAARAIRKKLHDLLYPPVDEDQNAAVLYMKAIELAKQKPGLLRMQGLDGAVYTAALSGNDLNPEQKAAIKAWFDANGAFAEDVSRLLREAGHRTMCRFPTEFPPLNSLQQACQLLRVTSMVQQEAGKTAEASENTLAGLAMARSMRDTPDILSQMIGYASDMHNFAALQGSLSPASPKIAGWLEAVDPGAVRDSYLRALLGNVDYVINAVFTMKDDPSKIPDDQELRKQLANPLILQDLAMYVEGVDAFSALVGKPYYETRDDLAALARQYGELAPWYASISQDVLSSMPGLSSSIARSEALTSMAKLSLDLERYREKNGSYPATLDALGTSTARDPFTGQPFGYRREGSGFVLDSPGDGKKPLSWTRRN